MRVRVVVGMVLAGGAGADGATDVAIGAARMRQQGADGHEAAAALRSAAQATIGLSGRTGTRIVLAVERREDLRMGQNVARTNDHGGRVV